MYHHIHKTLTIVIIIIRVEYVSIPRSCNMTICCTPPPTRCKPIPSAPPKSMFNRVEPEPEPENESGTCLGTCFIVVRMRALKQTIASCRARTPTESKNSILPLNEDWSSYENSDQQRKSQ